MALAGYAIDFMLSNEGGFIDNVSDSGGATNFGVSLRFLRELSEEKLRKYGFFKSAELLNSEDVKELTREQAILIYQNEFWNAGRYKYIKDQSVADYVFDMVVQHGEHQAVKIVQRALWAVYQKADYNDVTDDGILGERTLSLINATTSRSLCMTMASERAGFVRLLAATRPKDYVFLDGWLSRCYRW